MSGMSAIDGSSRGTGTGSATADFGAAVLPVGVFDMTGGGAAFGLGLDAGLVAGFGFGLGVAVGMGIVIPGMC